MDQIDNLRAILKKANVSDEEMSNGVRLTLKGRALLTKKLNITEDDLIKMLDDLKDRVADDTEHTGLPEAPGIFNESEDRYTYESDFMGNVALRDTQTGASRFIQGDDAHKLLHEIERNHPNYQFLLAQYFTDSDLMEDASPSFDSEIEKATAGTYNFPYKVYFACARFWLEGTKPKIDVISLVDSEGADVPMTDALKADVTEVAWQWINKV